MGGGPVRGARGRAAAGCRWVRVGAAAVGGAREWPIELDTLLVQLAVERASVLKSSVLYMDPAKLFDKTDQSFNATPSPDESLLSVAPTDSDSTWPLARSETLDSSVSNTVAEREEQLLTRQASRRPLLSPARSGAAAPNGQ